MPDPKPSRSITPPPSSPSIAIVLGAGFSYCAGLPLQGEFPGKLVNFGTDPLNRTITAGIEEFLRRTFGWNSGSPMPSLETIFTMIDLSSGSGHTLGPLYEPSRLRALRRNLIHRVFSILDKDFRLAREIVELLERLLARDHQTAFVVLNWDIVLERHLENAAPNSGLTYGVNEVPWNDVWDSRAPVHVIKVHGSANWVYCDNCRNILYDRDRKLSLSINAGLLDKDLQLFDAAWPDGGIVKLSGGENRDCIICGSPVGPHIATFSFRKSFRTTAFSSSWAAAERALAKADRWLFIGYSLPNADFEFAHLLKIAQLKFSAPRFPRKRIDVVLKKAPEAEERFRQLFGPEINHVDQDGLTHYVAGNLRAFLA